LIGFLTHIWLIFSVLKREGRNELCAHLGSRLRRGTPECWWKKRTFECGGERESQTPTPPLTQDCLRLTHKDRGGALFLGGKSKLFIELLVCLYALIAEYVAILCTVLYSCQPWCLCSVQDAETLTHLPRQRAACVVAVAHCVVWGRFLDVGGGKNLWLCQNFVTHSSRCGARTFRSHKYSRLGLRSSSLLNICECYGERR
jgi:hypothetical protein